MNKRKKITAMVIGLIVAAVLVVIGGKQVLADMNQTPDTPGSSSQEAADPDAPSVVFHNGQLEAGKENWDSFVQDSRDGKAARIHLISQFDKTVSDADAEDSNALDESADEMVADAHTCEDSYLEFDGETYCYSCKHEKRNYKYLLKLTGRLHGGVNDMTEVILSNEKYSFEQLEKSFLSSNSDDHIPYKFLFFHVKGQEESQENSFAEKAYKNLCAELVIMEREYKTYDYQKEVDLRLNTLQTSLEDITGEIEREENDEQKSNLKNRYKKLDSVYQKYKDLVDRVKDESEYEEIAGSLDEDLEAVYKELNG